MDAATYFTSSFEPGVLLLSTIVCILCTVCYVLSQKRKHNFPPGPSGLPLVGYYPFLGSKPYETLNELGKKFGSIFSVALGQKRVVILNDWFAVKEVLGSSATTYRPEGMFDIVPNGLGFGGANGPEWAEQRKYTAKSMKDIGLGRAKWEELLQEEVEDTVKKIKQHVNEPLEITQLFTTPFVNNILTLTLGRQVVQENRHTDLVARSVDHIIKEFPALLLYSFLPVLFWFSKKIGLLRNTMNELGDFTKFIEKNVKEGVENKEGDEDSFATKYYQDMQNIKNINPKSSFSDKFMFGNTQVLILGGTDTSRTGLSWCLYAMAKHQSYQDKVHKELDSVIGKDGRITWSQRTNLPYTYACILESMRWKPIVPINSQRVAGEDIEVQGYVIPKGTVVIANFWALHNDPRFWTEPEKFNPERFLDEKGDVKPKPDSYAPFSYGKRACPGELIAMMEILFYFVPLMQQFRVYPIDGVSDNYVTVLGLTHQVKNLHLRFVCR